MRGRHAAGDLALALALMATVGAARADEETDPAAEARKRYNLGTQAFTAKRFVDAALNFEAAARERPHAVTLYTAGLAWEQASQPERAADDFARALDVPGLSTQQQASARERLASYEAMIGTVVVIAPEPWRVQIDAFTEVAAPARLHATAGVHTLSVRAAGKPVARRDVVLEAGQTLRVELDARALDKPEPVHPQPAASPQAPRPTPPPAAPEPPSRGPEPRFAIGLALAGAGVAALAGGVVLGTQALGARDAYDAGPTAASLGHARSLETWTTVSLVVGGALTAGGLALALWPSSRGKDAPREALRLAPVPGGAVLGGRF